MGLSRSKPREKKVEEQKKNSTSFVTKSKEKVMEKESKHSDKEALNQPADSLLFGSGTAKHSRPSSSSEGFLCVLCAFPGTLLVAQAGLELTEILMLLPPECWDYRRAPPPPSGTTHLKAASDACHTALLLEEKQVGMKRKPGEDGSRKDDGASSAVTEDDGASSAVTEDDGASSAVTEDDGASSAVTEDDGASSAVTRKKTLAHVTLEGPSEHDVRCPCPYTF